MPFKIDANEDFKALSVSARTDMETKLQKVDKTTKLPVWSIQCLYTPSDGGKAQLVQMSLTSQTEPMLLAPLTARPVQVEMDYYSVGNSNGLWWRCADLEEL